MQTRSLETLVRIEQVQSFSKAADLQNMTLSALSMQMKSLETRLDVRLFDRSFRPPKLTPLGRSIAVQAARILKEQDALTAMCGRYGELVGRFRLGLISSVSVRLLPKFLNLIRQDAPNASFELTTGLSEDLSEQVLQGLIDAAVMTSAPSPPKGLRFDAIAREEMAFAAPRQYADTAIEDLAQSLPFIHFRPTTGIGNLIADHVRRHTNKPRETIILDNLEASMEFVKEGLGYTLLPLPDIRRCADNRVHIFPESASTMYRELALVSRQDSSHVRWIQAILETFRSVTTD